MQLVGVKSFGAGQRPVAIPLDRVDLAIACEKSKCLRKPPFGDLEADVRQHGIDYFAAMLGSRAVRTQETHSPRKQPERPSICHDLRKSLPLYGKPGRT